MMKNFIYAIKIITATISIFFTFIGGMILTMFGVFIIVGMFIGITNDFNIKNPIVIGVCLVDPDDNLCSK